MDTQQIELDSFSELETSEIEETSLIKTKNKKTKFFQKISQQIQIFLSNFFSQSLFFYFLFIIK